MRVHETVVQEVRELVEDVLLTVVVGGAVCRARALGLGEAQDRKGVEAEEHCCWLVFRVCYGLVV